MQFFVIYFAINDYLGKETTTEYYDEYGDEDYDANAIYGQQKKFAPQSALAHKKVK